MAQVFSCEYCKIFKNAFFLQSTSDGCFCMPACSSEVTLFCVQSWPKADQNKIVQVIFFQNHCCMLRANIEQVIFLCNIVSDCQTYCWTTSVYDFPTMPYAMFSQLGGRHNIVQLGYFAKKSSLSTMDRYYRGS